MVPTLVGLYYFYHKSPKKLRQLREVAEAMEEHVTKPARANGTRWVSHKLEAVTKMCNNYKVKSMVFYSVN